MVRGLFGSGDDARTDGKMTQRPMIKMMALLAILVGGTWPVQGYRLPATSWGLVAGSSPAQAIAYGQPAVRVPGRALTAPSAATARMGTLPLIGHARSRVTAHWASAGARFPASLSAPTPSAHAEPLDSLGATVPELPLLAQTDRPLQEGYPPPPPEIPSVTPPPAEYVPPPTVRPFQLATMTPGPGERPSSGEPESPLTADPSPRFGLYAGFGVSLLILIAGLAGMLRYGWHKGSPDRPDNEAD